MVAKHLHLPTHKLVLVAEAGFTAQARKAADAAGAVAIAPEDLGEGDPTYEIVNRLRSIWPKSITLTPEGARIFVRRPGEGSEYETKWFRSMVDHLIFLDGESELGTAIDIVVSLTRANMPNIVDQIDLVNITESERSKFVLRVGPPWRVHDDEGVERGLAVRSRRTAASSFMKSKRWRSPATQ